MTRARGKQKKKKKNHIESEWTGNTSRCVHYTVQFMNRFRISHTIVNTENGNNIPMLCILRVCCEGCECYIGRVWQYVLIWRKYIEQPVVNIADNHLCQLKWTSCECWGTRCHRPHASQCFCFLHQMCEMPPWGPVIWKQIILEYVLLIFHEMTQCLTAAI